jgi:hypothetical protein
MKTFLKLSFLLFSLLFLSCGANYEVQAENAIELSDISLEETAVADNAMVENNNLERKIIRTGRIEFLTADAAETARLLGRVVAQFNGWIGDESSHNYDSYDDVSTRYSVTVRSPAKYFDALLDSLAGNAEKVEYKSITAQDVTEEFIDVEARLAVKKELENRYKDLLKQAVKVEEILSIEKELGNLRSDIESIEGRYKYLQNQVAFSTLDITYYEEDEGSFGFGSKVVDGLANGWDMILWFFIGVINLWAFIILGALLVYLFIKWRRRKRLK